MRKLLNLVALLFSALGSLFVFLESMRISARMPKSGFTIGDPKGWEAWYWHWGLYGGGLVLLSIVIQGVALAMED